MHEHTHAEHRPPERTPSSFGVFYPEGDIIAVLDERAEAERAVAELRAAGIPDGDVDLATGEQVLEFDRAFRAGQNWSGRLGRAVSYLFSNDARYEDDFARSARAGRQFLAIHAPHDETAELARPILNAHKARLARYFRQGSVEDMVYPRPD